MNDERLKALNEVKNASPIDIVSKIQQFELYDAKSSQEIIDEVYKEFASGENLTESVVEPVFLSVIDGLMEAVPSARKARKKGMTASRVLKECKEFKYGDSINSQPVDGYTEYKNMRDQTGYDANYTTSHDSKIKESFNESTSMNLQVRSEYSTTVDGEKNSGNKHYADKNKKEEYGKAYYGENKSAPDEYIENTEGYKVVHRKENNPDKRRPDSDARRFSSNVDHIIPLSVVHEQFKGNYALSDNDIKNIANIDDNFAITSATFNKSVNDKLKEDYVNTEKGKIFDPRDRAKMVQMSKDAQTAVNSKANKAVAENLNILKKKEGVDKNKIYEQNFLNAKDQAKDNAVGDLMMFIIKPLFYEISDIFKNGMTKGVGVSSTSEALKIRFTRIKNHVLENAKNFLGDSVLDFIKGILSSIIEGFIGLFVGMFKQVLKIIKEGIKIFVGSAKILFGKESKQLSKAEKGDAIIKLLGGSIITIAGVGIEALMNKIGIVEPYSIILSTLISGVAATLFMYILDKVDLFSVKAEKRRDRIREIFELRINDINETSNELDQVALAALKKDYLEFEESKDLINVALSNNDMEQVNEGLYKIANSFNLELEYSNTDEFVDFFDNVGGLSF